MRICLSPTEDVYIESLIESTDGLKICGLNGVGRL